MKLKHVAVGVFMVVLVGQCGDSVEVAPGVRDGAGQAAVTEGTATPERPRTGSRRTREPTPSTSARPPGRGTALAALGLLAVKGRAPMTGYDRDRFGPAWLDADRNGCDTRNDILGQHLTDVTLESNGCVVASGAYVDPYTGSRIDYRQGHGALIDVDHVVSMGNGWVTGAFAWHIKERAAFANDPLNLLPADAGANRQKGDGDAATWLPANKSFRCSYVARQVAVKSKYDLWVTAPEKAAIERVLSSCPDEPLTLDAWGASTEVDHDIADPGDEAGGASSSAPPAPVPSSRGGSTPFSNCDAARAAGAAPVRLGDAGYGDHLDGDGDGIACE